MILDFEKEVVLAEDVQVFAGDFCRAGKVVVEKAGGRFALQTCGHSDKPVMMHGEDLLVYPGLVVETFEMCGGDECHQIRIPGAVCRKQNEMRVGRPRSIALPFETASGCDIRLAAEDGLNPLGHRVFVEVYQAVQHAMIGNCDSRHVVGQRRFHNLPDAACAVQKTVARVQMKMDEFLAFHELTI